MHKLLSVPPGTALLEAGRGRAPSPPPRGQRNIPDPGGTRGAWFQQWVPGSSLRALGARMCLLKMSWALQPALVAAGLSLVPHPDFPCPLRSLCPLQTHLHLLSPVPSSPPGPSHAGPGPIACFWVLIPYPPGAPCMGCHSQRSQPLPVPWHCGWDAEGWGEARDSRKPAGGRYPDFLLRRHDAGTGTGAGSDKHLGVTSCRLGVPAGAHPWACALPQAPGPSPYPTTPREQGGG